MMFRSAVATKLGQAQRQVAFPFNVPSPTGGINARDAYTDMDPKDAVGLTNVFPEANYVAVRKGFAPISTLTGNAFNTLLVWNGLTGVDKLFGAAGSAIYDVSTGTASSVVTGLANSMWQWTNIETPGGIFLVACNGADAVRNYDGTTWTTPTITGTDSTKFINVCQFKERLWFAPVNSLTLYYLDIQSIAGVASAFPLGSVFRRGGNIVAMGSFSNDAGEGPDDYFSIITSNGEIAVYQGTDPNSATTWSLVGLFDIGKPIGRRSTIRWDGDLSIITQDGVYSMKAALQYDRSAGQKATITSKIQTLFSQYTSVYSGNFGWQLCVYPKSRYMIVNVPQITGMTQIQAVMNTITGSWATFNNMNANCWAVANDKLYFGGNSIAGVSTVYQADDGYLDNAANQIDWEAQTSWQAWGGQMNKLFTATRPVMLTGGGTSFAIGVDVDFVVKPPIGALSTTVTTGMVWPFTWPGTWGGQNVLDAKWHTVGSIGTWASIHLKGAIKGAPCQLNSFDLGMQKTRGTFY